MKTLLAVLLVSLAVFASPKKGALTAMAQSSGTGHYVTLTWTDTIDTTAEFNAYKLLGSCPSTVTLTSFTKINSTLISADQYQDSAVIVGDTYCYVVTAVVNTLESLPSNTTSARILPAPPQNAVAQQSQ